MPTTKKSKYAIKMDSTGGHITHIFLMGIIFVWPIAFIVAMNK